MLVKTAQSRQILCLIITMLWNSVTPAPTLSTATPPLKYEQEYAAIMEGITELNLQGAAVPGELLVTGEQAFPLMMNSKGNPQMAAATVYELGHLIALGHESYLTALPPGLIVNMVKWLKGVNVGNHVGVKEGVQSVGEVLSRNGFRVTVVPKFGLEQFDVYLTDSYGVGEDAESFALFMSKGGGVLLAGQAWEWAQANGGNVLREFPGNKVSGLAGVYFTSGQGERATVTVRPHAPLMKSLGMTDTFKEDIDFLLKDVEEIEIGSGSSVSELLVHGRLAFPIAWETSGYDREMYVAGGYYGKGRFLVIGHESYLGFNVGFWENVLQWLDQGRQGTVGVDPYHYTRAVKKTSFREKMEVTEFKYGLSVFVGNSWRETALTHIQNFVAEGGGLLLAGQCWRYNQLNSDNYLVECPGNKILYPMGVSILSSTISGGEREVPDTDTSLAVKENHLRPLLDNFLKFVTESEDLTEHEQIVLANRTHHLFTYLQTANYQSYFYQQVMGKLRAALMDKRFPENLKYDVATSNPREKLLLSVASEIYKSSPNQDELIRILHPNLPQLPTVQNQRITVTIATGEKEEWLSTGLYLSPGMKTTVTFPPEMVNKDWQVQIGCQTDHLDIKKDLSRAPVVYERFPVNSENVQVDNFWGGLIYIVAPDEIKVTDAVVTVHQAVLAPYYKSGVTNIEEWPEIRNNPAPWAELEMDNLVLSVPSDAIRNLEKENLLKVAELWNNVMIALCELSQIPPKLPRKERMVFDVQISVGHMHSGYPIMGHTPKGTRVTNLEEIEKNGLWGPFHELGHNQQLVTWQTEFSPYTGETTCNLWSLYIQEKVLKVDKASYQGNEITPQYRAKTNEKWVKEGKKMDDYNTWVMLETYMMLEENFGWDVFKQVFKAYQGMDDSTIPSETPAKMNLYTVTFSQILGQDLSAFFKCWNWPITRATEKKLSALPAWRNDTIETMLNCNA